MPATDKWVIVPVIDCLDYTVDAIGDLLAQEFPGEEGARARILLVDNGSSPETRAALGTLAKASQRRLFVISHNPPLGGPPFGALNATWNAGLAFCWLAGAERVLVANNDIRVRPTTYACLERAMAASNALFVSAVGVGVDEFERGLHQENGPGVYDPYYWSSAFHDGPEPNRGGPDFSCFVISRECHEKFPFDPQFTYCGDLDYHRRLMLAGQARRIFSINVPYLHYASKTINRSPEIAEKFARSIAEHRKRYAEKWGGGANEEKYGAPYDPSWTSHPDPDWWTTPQLQARCQQ